MSRHAAKTWGGVVLLAAALAARAGADTVISRCADIRQSGFYTLDRDITGAVGSACLQIRDVSDVHLDCRGHSITTDAASLAAMLIQDVKNFTITSCALPQRSGLSLLLGNSTNGTIEKNTLKDMVVYEPGALAAASLRIVGNQFSEFGLGDPMTTPFSPDETAVIPVAPGVNWILARHLAIPNLDPAALPAGTATVAAEIAPIVFPNPWRSDRTPNQPVTFDRLPANSTVAIFTLSAHAVATLRPSADKAFWDLRNDSGDLVASGIYIYLVTNDQGQKTVGKFAVIR